MTIISSKPTPVTVQKELSNNVGVAGLIPCADLRGADLIAFNRKYAPGAKGDVTRLISRLGSVLFYAGCRGCNLVEGGFHGLLQDIVIYLKYRSLPFGILRQTTLWHSKTNISKHPQDGANTFCSNYFF